MGRAVEDEKEKRFSTAILVGSGRRPLQFVRDALVRRPAHPEQTDGDGESAATQWEQIFGIPRSRDLVAFTNARLGFMRGEEGKQDGIVSISIGVRGEKKRNEILQRAEERGLLERDGGSKWVNMFGIKWYFSLTSNDEEPASKL